METKFTPGPWVVNPLDIAYENNSIFASTPTSGARRLVTTVTTGAESSANARLIAAAPELLEAAQLVIAWYEAEENHDGTDFCQRIEMCRTSENAIRAAIAKATGSKP